VRSTGIEGTWTLGTLQLANGSHQLSAKARDLAGDESASTTVLAADGALQERAGRRHKATSPCHTRSHGLGLFWPSAPDARSASENGTINGKLLTVPTT
jgi:X-X-X-Leu-X-X-Gly heptad repeat protein